MNEIVTTITGNLTDDPELRFTPSGVAVANFRVASTPASFNSKTGKWDDGETAFINCTVWRQVAQNVAESLTKGSAVIVHGNLKHRHYETKDGRPGVATEMDVRAVGPNLKNATAQVTKNPKREDNPAEPAPAEGEPPF